MKRKVAIGKIEYGSGSIPLIAGPCVIESRDHSLKMAEAIRSITDSLGIPFIYKSSFDKANRTSLTSPRGLGFEKAAPVFAEIKQLYHDTSAETVESDLQRAIELLKKLNSEEDRIRVAVYMDGLSQLRSEWILAARRKAKRRTTTPRRSAR